MAYAWRWLRSLVFNVQMYVMMLLIGIVFFPLALVSRWGARLACKSYANWVVWTAGWMLGLKSEVRGEPPTDEVILAAKHMSFFDVLLIFSAVPAGKFIMKREVLFMPIIGQYGARIGCVPVKRGKRGAAIKQMVEDVESGAAEPGQLVIYSQGTRVAPGEKLPYKVGTYVLARETGQDVVPVATNIGVFWPKRGVSRQAGVAVVEFLPRLAPDMEKSDFMAQLEETVETRSNALMREAGYEV
ncbi:1-acyl-sn-glycerol-3-phosphate acyltransferase [Thalassobius sp. Cn5-15]|jgi:1-acyl-sn-glycerol-3-phosphate acyltransferase|uniref:lysophospholipid acyltransferase family protein n=1 Tax=Thalassobius sp. Cn5-15 TaxID=2917763 RepID=UPI001EF390A6|nr:lysophospholipid acyltransferase family protein [Thalassobius sp. Cn5-15]MCG7493656.1 1-acyl-sn-glycerol-3-phosphate acyltransferase [Thalassobius sp. Cn5-15]